MGPTASRRGASCGRNETGNALWRCGAALRRLVSIATLHWNAVRFRGPGAQVECLAPLRAERPERRVRGPFHRLAALRAFDRSYRHLHLGIQEIGRHALRQPALRNVTAPRPPGSPSAGRRWTGPSADAGIPAMSAGSSRRPRAAGPPPRRSAKTMSAGC